MAEKKEDRRTRMTKDFLKNALIDLMKTKNINEISVKELCDAADVNRSTFYKHYDAITALYDDILRDVTNNFAYIVDCAKKDGTLFKTVYFEAILNYTENNRDLFLVLLSKNGNMGFGETLIKNTDTIIGNAKIPEPSRYCIYFVVSGMASLIWKWLTDEKRVSAHSMALVITSVLNRGVNIERFVENTKEKNI